MFYGVGWCARVHSNICIWAMFICVYFVYCVYWSPCSNSSQSSNVAIESLRDENNQVKQKPMCISDVFLLFLPLLMLSSLVLGWFCIVVVVVVVLVNVVIAFLFSIIFLSHRFQSSIISFFPKHLSHSKNGFFASSSSSFASRYTRATQFKPFKWIMLLLYFIRFANFIYANTLTLVFAKKCSDWY